MKLFKRDYYEKLFITRAQTVQDYQLQIAQAQEKIRDLQAKCEHPNFEVMFYSWRPGALQPSRVCKTCNFSFEASEEETKRLWDRYNKGNKND